jgi:septum formation protein
MPPASASPRLILASGSHYRQELLTRLHMPFEALIPGIEETPQSGELPNDTALRLAKEKARVISQQEPGALVIGSDQVATVDGEQMGKPGSHAKALRQLQIMQGRTVIFHTALCLWDGRKEERHAAQVENVQTRVLFRSLSDIELENYLHIEKPYDCAGSAKNEGLGIALIEKIESTDPTALTGLPLIALTTMLRNAGVPFFQV